MEVSVPSSVSALARCPAGILSQQLECSDFQHSRDNATVQALSRLTYGPRQGTPAHRLSSTTKDNVMNQG
ncbi:hypothetical protein cyc_03840 [Cyclospora cayetanensis]|uniref:Uncharacterized protein n=1 Tax=Cyclospora cayetanensis TaxID=88456 RepID=A0A1D3D9C0_9EIME|nr:hypothetical protein cyc_03840 [Cyclospora cayetanensis]